MTRRSLYAAILWTFVLSALCEAPSAARAQDIHVYSQSFEDAERGRFSALNLGIVAVTAKGTASISTQFARTGEKCLHLLGDEGNSLTFSIPESLQAIRGLSFHAERWTVRSPFEFKVEVQQSGAWTELAKLDQIIQVGARFRSHIKLVVPENGPTTAIRFSIISAEKAGLLIDDLVFHATPPVRPSSLEELGIPTKKLELLSSQALFISGENETHTFRIPAIATATNGDLIVACDARKNSSADIIHERAIDIVFRRSVDSGQTWTPMEVMDPVTAGGCSDPSLIVDETTSDIFCFYNYMSNDKASKEYRFYVQKSANHGKSWSVPVDITEQIAGPELKDAFKFITSGRGIQTRDGKLIHNFVHVEHGATLFSSDDHGESWSPMNTVRPGDESKVVQLHDDSLMVNSRFSPGMRFVHRSSDGGKTWDSSADQGLPDPRCNACIIQYTAKKDGYLQDRLIFCNAASNSGRKNLAVRISYDGGLTWSQGRVIDAGEAAYSEMTILGDGSLGVLYEPGHKEIRFVRFTLEALTDGKDKLSKPWKR
jgi:hypothetical protein